MSKEELENKICNNCKMVYESVSILDNLCEECTEEQEESGEYNVDFLDEHCDCPYCTGELSMEIF